MSSMLIYLEPMTRFELVTPSLPRKCSTSELHRHVGVCVGCKCTFRAENGARTRHLQLGRLSLYQMSYFRVWGEEDSNLRRLRQQIYSLPHLTALVSPRYFFQRTEPMDGFEPPTS